MPTTRWFIPLDELPEAPRLADLAGIEWDLKFAQEITEHIDEVQRDPRAHHPRLAEALFTAAIVRYARCFKGGKRREVECAELLAGLEPEQRKLHDDVLTIRDKHVAHSVNAFEEGFVDAVVSDDPNQVRVEQVSYGGAFFQAFHGSSLERFMDLLRAVHERVRELIKAQMELARAAAQRLDYDELRARPMRTVPTFDRASAYRTRKTKRSPRRP